jgi:sarcosine oxidase/L-pipecolate oxidase
MEESNQQECNVVVGGGMFGVSTATAYKRQFPETQVILIAGIPARKTASSDINKIVRAAYPVPEYALLAEEAKQEWQNNDLYEQFFHKTSWIQVRDEGENQNTHQCENDKPISITQYLHRTGAKDEPVLNKNESLWVNENIALVDSAMALQAAIGKAKLLGVTVVMEDVTELILDDKDGHCLGVRMGGKDIKAGRTILAAGAWTPGLLQKSNIRLFDDEVSEKTFFTVTAVGVATLALSDEEFERLKGMPIVVTNKGMIWPILVLSALLMPCRRGDVISSIPSSQNYIDQHIFGRGSQRTKYAEGGH